MNECILQRVYNSMLFYLIIQKTEKAKAKVNADETRFEYKVNK